MSRFALIPLGIGEYFSKRHYNSNFLILLGDRIVAVDCPAPYRRILSDNASVPGRQIDYGDIDDLILTHLHGDHSNGVEELLLYRHYVLGMRTRIYTTPIVAEELWSQKLAASMAYTTRADGEVGKFGKSSDYYDVVPWDFGGTFELHGARFETRRTHHPVPTFGFRCTFEGRSFGYSCDTSFDPDYVRWLGACDLFIHECNHGIHTRYAELLGVDAALLAKMRLIHIPDDFDPSTSQIAVLREGVPIEL